MFYIESFRFWVTHEILHYFQKFDVGVGLGLFHKLERKVLHHSKIWCYSIAGEYLVYILVPIGWIFSQSFLNVGFKYFLEYFQFPIALRVIRCGEDMIDAVLLENLIHQLVLNSVTLSDKM